MERTLGAPPPILAASPAAEAPRPSDGASRPRTDLAAVAHVLVLVQGAILVAATLEAVAFLAFIGAASTASLGLTATAAVLTLATAGGLARGSRRARRWTLIAETGVILVTLVDLVLALVLAGEPLGPVALLAGLVAPAAVIVILRRERSR